MPKHRKKSERKKYKMQTGIKVRLEQRRRSKRKTRKMLFRMQTGIKVKLEQRRRSKRKTRKILHPMQTGIKVKLELRRRRKRNKNKTLFTIAEGKKSTRKKCDKEKNLPSTKSLPKYLQHKIKFIIADYILQMLKLLSVQPNHLIQKEQCCF